MQAPVIVFVSFPVKPVHDHVASAMATNGPVEAGGAYYIISRALGHKLGGAVGTTYYLGLSLLAVLEVLGAVEVMLSVEPALDMGMPAAGAVRVWAVVLTAALGGMVWGGMQLVSKLGLFFGGGGRPDAHELLRRPDRRASARGVVGGDRVVDEHAAR